MISKYRMLLSPCGRTVNASETRNQTHPEVKRSSEEAAHLPAQVHYVGVGVVEGQQNAVAGVHLLNAYGFIHVVLERQKTG